MSSNAVHLSIRSIQMRILVSGCLRIEWLNAKN